jgi:uncharacterized damage-inducible protein DinB
MTLGELAWHIASIPGRIAEMIERETFDIGAARPADQGGSEFIERLRESLAIAHRIVGALDDDAIKQPFTMVRDGEVIHRLPKVVAVRTIMLNHSYHHRGQLTVYLRLLDVPLPATYASSADEKAF